MTGVRLFMFFVLLPALVALGHDIYLFAVNEGTDNVIADAQQAFEDKGALTFFASLGFIWTNYYPESFKTVLQSVDQETWATISSFLSFKAFFVALAFAGVFYVLLGFMKLLKIGPYKPETVSRFGRSSAIDKVMGKETKKFEYKRK